MKKSLLMILITFSLTACSTMEIVHSPLGCLDNPDVSIGLSAEELKAINSSEDDKIKELQDSALKKIVIFAKILRARIDTQCKINLEHDRLHGDK